MGRRIVRKRPYTPDQDAVGTSSNRSVDSDVEEIIDVETIQSVRFVDVQVQAASLYDTKGKAVPLKSCLLCSQSRPENLTASLVTGPRKSDIRRHSGCPDAGPTATSKRAPILADEGIGTFAIAKLPLEEMSMSTKVLRAIQEDHSLSKAGTVHVDTEGHQSVAGNAKVENQRKAVRRKSSFDALACPHPHCQLSFPHIDDLISHLVSFHCQHQFRQRKLTFISLEKYEAWKSSQEKLFATTMIEEADREENEGVIRLRYSCEYCDGWRRKLEKNGFSKEGMCMRVLLGCPAHFTVSISRQQAYIVVFGCFAHLGHRKKLPPAINRVPDPNVQSDRWKTSPVGIKRFKSLGTTIECGDPHCDVVCDRMSTLCEHVAREHSRDDLLIEEFRFADLHKFKSWKDQVETDTISKFVLSSSRTRASGIIQSYYLCHLSGYANRSRHSSMSTARSRTTKKLGRYCTAFINTKELLDGSVTVQCCLGHFGHGFDVRRLPLPNKGNNGNHFVRFQSMRSLPDSQNPNNPTTASHTVVEELRDLSPPIIGASTYTEYDEEDEYSNLDMVVVDEGDVGHSLTYFIDEAESHESPLDTNHARNENTAKTMSSKMAPLLMEPQPTGNVDFDETMTSLKRRINVLSNQIKRTIDTSKRDILIAQVRNLQAQLVRGVPQTTTFFHLAEEEPDGEEDEDDFAYEPVDRDDTVCLEVEVQSSEAPYGVQIPEEHYDDMSGHVFEGEPYEEVVSAGYEQSSELSYS
uniref:C2H2-type domain-containing protein n=1 Tax=Angiostrongylus cantonensis TaxID=6313 RepID=A0A158P6Q4_ANGCA